MSEPPPAPPELRCPHCGETDLRLIDVQRRLYLCNVCSKTWPRVEQDVNGHDIDGP